MTISTGVSGPSAKLESLSSVFKNYLEKNLPHRQPEQLYEPIRYFLQLGGKRLRPVIVLLSCSLYNEDFSKALPVAYSIELFHNFTLIHDDIMDDAKLRRGQPTVHIKYDNPTAILAGDAMLVLAYQHLAKLNGEKNYNRIFDVITETSVAVCEGQQYDLVYEQKGQVTIEEYLKMIELKTAVLLAVSFQTGALAGGASLVDAELLYEFGRNLGISFQLQDDLLDTYGKESITGKRVGGDIILNKKTILLVEALQTAEGEVKDELLKWLQSPENPQEKIEKITSIYEQLEVRQKAEELKNSYLDKALTFLEKTSLKPERKEVLQNFARDLMKRKS